MKSIQITRFGGPEVFKLIDSPTQSLEAGQVRIQVHAAGVNFADIMMRMGMYPEAPKTPFVPGYEVAGMISEIGPEVSGFAVGDRVLSGTQFRGYTQELIAPTSWVRKIPAGLSFAEAASIPVNFLTAWLALSEMCRVRKGDRVLIQSAAGGVGLAAVQLAHLAGAHVTGIVGGDSKAASVKRHGADAVVLRNEWQGMSDSDAGEFDIILDSTGGSELKRSFRRLAPAGRVVSFGVSSLVKGPKRSIFTALPGLLKTPLFTPFQLMMANRGVFGLNLLQIFDRPMTPGSILDRGFSEILELFEAQKLKACIDSEFPLERAGDAQIKLQGRSTVGKIVLICNS